MGINKAARMMMMNRSSNNENRNRDYDRNEHRGDRRYSDNRSNREYYGDGQRYGEDLGRMDGYQERGEDYGGYNHDRRERSRRDSYEDYGNRREVRAGGTFWMDNLHKKKFDRKTAEEWVAEMESRDGAKGGKWTYDQTTQVMKQKGFECDPVDFFVAMNAIYSDYGKTLSKHGVTAADAYAELAYDWVKDPDARKDKAARYYEYIVK